MAETLTLLIWDTPESESAYRALVDLRAAHALKAISGREAIIDHREARTEIERVMTRLLIEHSRPGEFITEASKI